MIYLVGGVLLLVLLLAAGRAFVEAEPATVRRASAWIGGIVAAGVAVLLILSGEIFLLAILLAASTLAARRGRLYWKRWLGIDGAARQGRVSEIETAYLRMSLEHDTGAIAGTVRKGPYQGRRLGELDLAALLALWREVRAEEPASVQLLEGYLDRFQPDWRERVSNGQGPQEPRATTTMTEAEALAVLGLTQGAGPAEIKDAHRRLMMKLHPDQGGSTVLAVQVNLAKEVLLRE